MGQSLLFLSPPISLVRSVSLLFYGARHTACGNRPIGAVYPPISTTVFVCIDCVHKTNQQQQCLDDVLQRRFCSRAKLYAALLPVGESARQTIHLLRDLVGERRVAGRASARKRVQIVWEMLCASSVHLMATRR